MPDEKDRRAVFDDVGLWEIFLKRPDMNVEGRTEEPYNRVVTPSQSGRPNDICVGVHMGYFTGYARPVPGDPRYAIRKTISCRGSGSNCTVRLAIFFAFHDDSKPVDGEIVTVTLRKNATTRSKQVARQHDTPDPFEISIPGCGDVQIEVDISEGNTPGIQSEITDLAIVAADCA